MRNLEQNEQINKKTMVAIMLQKGHTFMNIYEAQTGFSILIEHKIGYLGSVGGSKMTLEVGVNLIKI